MNDQQSKGDTEQSKPSGSGEDKKVTKSKKSNKNKTATEETGNFAAGYLKDISKINQDIENIKSRGSVNKKKNGSDKESK